MNAKPISPATIEHLAYEIYERKGRPEGRALEHWREAEKELGDDNFLQREMEVEEAEGGLVPKT